ncbi:MAG: hypothetical protein K1X74_05505 [Pirellulales bacterium]|nr:hypothetical protein [Pirellulales bacterium]
MGCNRENNATAPIDLYPVRGNVTYRGRPTPGAVIYFHPVDNSPYPRPHAELDAEGGFQLSTFRLHDGAPAGTYRVTVSWKVLPEGASEYLNAEDRDEGDEQLPKRYLHAGSTPWEITVQPGTNDLGNLEIEP